MKRAKTPKKKPAPPRHEDPRVLAVLAAFDRFVGSPARDHDEYDPHGASLLDGFMRCVVNSDVDTFSIPTWPPAAMRAVLLAYCLNAPESELGKFATSARREVAWLDNFERDPDGDVRGYSLITGMPTGKKARTA